MPASCRTGASAPSRNRRACIEGACRGTDRGAGGFGIEIVIGEAACTALARRPVDVVVAGIVGLAGLPSVIAALECGQTVALANKESLVSAGALVTRTAARTAPGCSGGQRAQRGFPVLARMGRACRQGRDAGRHRVNPQHLPDRFRRPVPRPAACSSGPSRRPRRCGIRTGRWGARSRSTARR